MNRRAFLTALGAVAQLKWSRLPSRSFDVDVSDTEPPAFTTSRFPYVQNVRNDSASILWATFEPGVGMVEYSSDGVNFTSVVAKSQAFSRLDTNATQNFVQYRTDLTKLSPSTDYIYRVTVNGQDISAAGATRFRTAGPGPFNFFSFGDSGWGLADSTQQFQFIIAQRMIAENPALVIHTGDLAYNPSGTFDSYQRNYFNYYAASMSSVPFFPCPGNHDYEVPSAAAYLAVHAVPTDGVPAQDRGRYYSYDWGNVHFVSIDSIQSLAQAVNGSGPMLQWLDNDLRSTRQFWRVVYFHYPPYATGPNENDPPSFYARQYLVPILEANGVQIVLSGHEHSYQRSQPIRKSTIVSPNLGTNYFTSGGGGALLYPAPDKPMVAFRQSVYHYLRGEVRGTGITIRSIRYDGAEVDSYTVAPSPVFSDDPKVKPITLTPAPVAGAVIRIIGRNLASEETFLCTPTPTDDMAGTTATVNGRPIQLLYVSPTQIYGQLPFSVDGNVTVRITTANGFVETSV